MGFQGATPLGLLNFARMGLERTTMMTGFATRSGTRGKVRDVPGPTAQVLFMLVVCIAAVAGFLVGDARATSSAATADGADLVRLLRGMAALKTLMAGGATLAVLWRMGSSAPLTRFAAYALCCATMWTGPGLIWSLVYVRTGALLLHGGLLASLVLLWRDPAIAARLAAVIQARRASLR